MTLNKNGEDASSRILELIKNLKFKKNYNKILSLKKNIIIEIVLIKSIIGRILFKIFHI